MFQVNELEKLLRDQLVTKHALEMALGHKPHVLSSSSNDNSIPSVRSNFSFFLFMLLKKYNLLINQVISDSYYFIHKCSGFLLKKVLQKWLISYQIALLMYSYLPLTTKILKKKE